MNEIKGVVCMWEFDTTDRTHHTDDTDIVGCILFYYTFMREIVEKFLVSNIYEGNSGEVPGKQLEFNGK